jgi:hypothetical protein
MWLAAGAAVGSLGSYVAGKSVLWGVLLGAGMGWAAEMAFGQAAEAAVGGAISNAAGSVADAARSLLVEDGGES